VSKGSRDQVVGAEYLQPGRIRWDVVSAWVGVFVFCILSWLSVIYFGLKVLRWCGFGVYG